VDDPTRLHHDEFASSPEVVQLIGQAFTDFGGIATTTHRTLLADGAGNGLGVLILAPQSPRVPTTRAGRRTRHRGAETRVMVAEAARGRSIKCPASHGLVTGPCARINERRLP
jgi:hypothetical protein